MDSTCSEVYVSEELADNGRVKLKMIINYQVGAKASINSGLLELNANNSFSSSFSISYNLSKKDILLITQSCIVGIPQFNF